MATSKAAMDVVMRAAGESRFQVDAARYANDLCVAVSRCRGVHTNSTRGIRAYLVSTQRCIERTDCALLWALAHLSGL